MANSATYNRTKIHFAEGSAAATPDTGEVVIYALADGLMYQKDDAGTESAMGGTGGGAITTASALSTADVVLTADTPADATGVSVSLAAGTWMIWGSAGFTNSNATALYCLGTITDAANAVVGAGRGIVASTGLVTLAFFAIVSPGSTTTYKVRGQMGGGAGTETMVRYTDGTNVATKMIAIKVA